MSLKLGSLIQRAFHRNDSDEPSKPSTSPFRDKLIAKIIACIPVIGHGYVIFGGVEGKLKKQAVTSYDKFYTQKDTDHKAAQPHLDNAIEAIQTKNHYKIAAIVRNLITMAAVTAIAIALFIAFPKPLFIVFGVLAIVTTTIALVGKDLIEIYKNHKLLNVLKEAEKNYYQQETPATYNRLPETIVVK